MGLSNLSRLRPNRVRGSEILSRGSVQVRGESFFYEASGMAENGPTILFLHESGGCADTWHGQLTGMAQGARCIVPDLPGHGKSEGLGCATVPEYRRVVLEFLDALAIQWPVTVAGLCLGAAVAADLALYAPNRVAGLVLSGVCNGGRASAQTMAAVGRGEAPETFIQGLFSGNVSPRLLSRRMQRWRLTSPMVRHNDLLATSEYPMLQAAQEVSHPVLLVAGELDDIASPRLASELADNMFNARAVTIRQAGCLVMVEQPGAFNWAMREFLDRLQPACPIGSEVASTGGYRRF